MNRQLIQIGNEALYERRLHISVHRRLVWRRDADGRWRIARELLNDDV